MGEELSNKFQNKLPPKNYKQKYLQLISNLAQVFHHRETDDNFQLTAMKWLSTINIYKRNQNKAYLGLGLS